MNEVVNKNSKEITKAVLSHRNSSFNWKCLIILSFFVLSAVSIFSFSYYNNKFLVSFKNYFDKKNQKKKEPVKYTYSFYITKITKIISLIVTILGILTIARTFYKDFFSKKKYEIADKEKNHSCFIKMLLDICLDREDKNSLRYREPGKPSNCTKHNRKLFFSRLLKKKFAVFMRCDLSKIEEENTYEAYEKINEMLNKKIAEILTEGKLADFFGALIEIRNADVNYFHLRNVHSFKESGDNENYKEHRNQCLFKTLLQFFDIIAYLSTSMNFDKISINLDNVEEKIKKRADEDNFVLVDAGKYIFSGVSLEEDLKDLYNNIGTDIDIN